MKHILITLCILCTSVISRAQNFDVQWLEMEKNSAAPQYLGQYKDRLVVAQFLVNKGFNLPEKRPENALIHVYTHDNALQKEKTIKVSDIVPKGQLVVNLYLVEDKIHVYSVEKKKNKSFYTVFSLDGKTIVSNRLISEPKEYEGLSYLSELLLSRDSTALYLSEAQVAANGNVEVKFYSVNTKDGEKTLVYKSFLDGLTPGKKKPVFLVFVLDNNSKPYVVAHEDEQGTKIYYLHGEEHEKPLYTQLLKSGDKEYSVFNFYFTLVNNKLFHAWVFKPSGGHSPTGIKNVFVNGPLQKTDSFINYFDKQLVADVAKRYDRKGKMAKEGIEWLFKIDRVYESSPGELFLFMEHVGLGLSDGTRYRDVICFVLDTAGKLGYANMVYKDNTAAVGEKFSFLLFRSNYQYGTECPYPSPDYLWMSYGVFEIANEPYLCYTDFKKRSAYFLSKVKDHSEQQEITFTSNNPGRGRLLLVNMRQLAPGTYLVFGMDYDIYKFSAGLLKITEE